MKGRWIGTALGVLMVVVILAIALGINWLVAGGNVRCMFSQDPALCATVGEVGE